MNGTLRYRRRRPEKVRSSSITNRGDDNQTDGDDEIIESLVKTGIATYTFLYNAVSIYASKRKKFVATKTPAIRTTQRERKRFRNSDKNAGMLYLAFHLVL